MVSTDHKVLHIRNSVLSSNTYVVTSEKNKNCVIIDPGMDEASIEKLLQEKELIPTDIIATHGHFDHVASVAFFQKKYGAKFHIHELDKKPLNSANFYLKIIKIEGRIEVPIPDTFFKGEKEEIRLDNFFFEVYNFPGHTNGSCVLKIANGLFTGDTLYAKGVGINHFPGYDNNKLRTSVTTIFEMFDFNMMVYPGHGGFDTLGNIEASNVELKEFLQVKSEA